MMKMSERAALYNAMWGKRFPASKLQVHNDVVTGMWMLGNNYRTSGFYGAYRPGFLPRLNAMFPDTVEVSTLHLFSGSLKPGPYVRFDMKQKADVQGDAEKLAQYFRPRQFKVIYADPPYTTNDADKYGTPLVNKRKVLFECFRVLRPGGHLIWLDQSHPMYRKLDWRLAGLIGIVGSTNHKYRVVSIFERR